MTYSRAISGSTSGGSPNLTALSARLREAMHVTVTWRLVGDTDPAWRWSGGTLTSTRPSANSCTWEGWRSCRRDTSLPFWAAMECDPLTPFHDPRHSIPRCASRANRANRALGVWLTPGLAGRRRRQDHELVAGGLANTIRRVARGSAPAASKTHATSISRSPRRCASPRLRVTGGVPNRVFPS